MGNNRMALARSTEINQRPLAVSSYRCKVIAYIYKISPQVQLIKKWKKKKEEPGGYKMEYKWKWSLGGCNIYYSRPATARTTFNCVGGRTQRRICCTIYYNPKKRSYKIHTHTHMDIFLSPPFSSCGSGGFWTMARSHAGSDLYSRQLLLTFLHANILDTLCVHCPGAEACTCAAFLCRAIDWSDR